MPQIHPHRARRHHRRSYKWLWRVLGVIVVLFVVGNVLLYVHFRQRTYPNTSILNLQVGNKTKGEVARAISQPDADLLPERVTLKHAERTQQVTTQELGIRTDTGKTTGIDHAANWLPLLQLFKQHRLDPPVRIDASVLQAKAETLRASFHKDPVNAQIALKDANFSTLAAQDGFTLDTTALGKRLVAELRSGKDTLGVPVRSLRPQITTSAAEATAQKLNAQLQTPLTYRLGNSTHVPNRAAIASWYTSSGSSYDIADTALGNYILQQARAAGIQPANVRDVMAKTKAALQAHAASEFRITPYANAKTIHYCVAGRGVPDSSLAAVRTKAAQTLNDIRGWSIDGQALFKEVNSGCDFTLWLSAASQVPSFGGVCDSMWSCRIGANVVINNDRWQNASPAWNKMGGTLDEYRDMVINHETGHWIGFGHDHCGGAGQPAPVMQQQSINLQGCTFSPWPSAAERSSARTKLGL